jgi:hypothetical protein
MPGQTVLSYHLIRPTPPITQSVSDKSLGFKHNDWENPNG